MSKYQKDALEELVLSLCGDSNSHIVKYKYMMMIATATIKRPPSIYRIDCA